MTTGQTDIVQWSAEKLYFDHKAMDYYFAWTVGRQIYGGSDTDE